MVITQKALAIAICLLLIQMPIAFAISQPTQTTNRPEENNTTSTNTESTNTESTNTESTNDESTENKHTSAEVIIESNPILKSDNPREKSNSSGIQENISSGIQEYILEVKNESGKLTTSISPKFSPRSLNPKSSNLQPDIGIPQPDIGILRTDSSCTNPYALDLDGWYWLTIDDRGEEDWIRWYIPGSQTFTVDLAVPSNRDYDLYVYRGCGQSPACDSRLGQGYPEQCSLTGASGYVYAKVVGFDGSAGSEKYYIRGQRGSPLPDLTGYGITIDPSSGDDSTSFAVTFKTNNQGNKDAPPFKTKLYLNGQLWWTCNYNDGLKKWYYNWCQTNRFTLPGGTYTVKSIADPDREISESDKTNNEESTNLVVQARARPDLYVYELSAPTSLNDRTSFNVGYSIGNKGGASAGHFLTYFYIDNQFRHGCEFLSLAVNQVRGCTSDQITLSAGRHYLKVVADANQELLDQNRADNSYETPRDVVVFAKPDLYVSSITTTPQSPFEGDSFSITWKTSNKGNLRAEKFNTTLSIDNTPWLICMFPGLDPGTTDGCTQTRSPLSVGSHTLSAIADVTNVVGESEEGNNEASAPVVIQARPTPKPELFIDELSAVPAQPKAGPPFSIIWGTSNQGEANAGPFHSRLHVKIGDQVLASWDCNFSTGLNQNRRSACTISQTLPAGTYTLEGIADVYNKVLERDDGNNQKTQGFLVAPADRVDLVPEHFAVDPSQPTTNRRFQFYYEARNSFGSAVSSFASDVYVDSAFSTTCQMANIPPGGKSFCNVSISGLPTGRHRLSVHLDPRRETSDENRDNNINGIDIDVKDEVVLPDFVVSSIWSEGDIVEGKPARIFSQVENHGGPGAATSTAIFVNNVLKATSSTPALGFLQFVDVPFTLEGLQEGIHHIRVRANVGGVSEQSLENNELPKTITVGKEQCSIPDGSGPSCTCFTSQDCPANRPYCENEYPLPVSEGYDACLPELPTYCGDTICNNQETKQSCPGDCGSPTSQITFTVHQQEKPLWNALVSTSGKSLRTDDFGRAFFHLPNNKGYSYSIQCPTGEACTTGSLYLGTQEAQVTANCPNCPLPGDFDGDGYLDEDEELVGTDPKDPSNNFKSLLLLQDPAVLGCANLGSWFSGFFSQAEREYINSAIQNNIVGINDHVQINSQTNPQTRTLQIGNKTFQGADIPLFNAPAGTPTGTPTDSEENGLFTSALQNGNQTIENRLFLHANYEAEEVEVVQTSSEVFIMFYDAQTGITSWFRIPPGCVGVLLGLGKGFLGGIWEDIKGFADLIKAGLEALKNPSLENVKETFDGMWKGLSFLFWNVGDVLYRQSMDIFKEGKETKKEWNLNYENQDLHEFQVAFFIFFVEGRLAAMTATAFIGGMAIERVAKALRVGLVVEKVATPLTKLLQRLKEYGPEVARIAQNSRLAIVVAEWGDTLAEEGFALYIQIVKDGSKIDQIAKLASDSRIFLSKLAQVARNFGEAFAGQLSRLQGGIRIIEHWSMDEIRKFKKVLDFFGEFEMDPIMKLAMGNVDDLKYVVEFFDSRFASGKSVAQTMSKGAVAEVSTKIARNYGKIEKEFGSNLIKEIAAHPDRNINLARGSDLFVKIAEQEGVSLKKIAPYFEKENAAIKFPDKAKARLDLMEDAGLFHDRPGIQEKVLKVIKDPDGGHISELKKAARFERQGHTIKGFDTKWESPAVPKKNLGGPDRWIKAAPGTKTHNGVDISGKDVAIEEKYWDWNHYSSFVKRKKLKKLDDQLEKLAKAKLGLLKPKIDVGGFELEIIDAPPIQRIEDIPDEIRQVIGTVYSIQVEPGIFVDVKAVDWVILR